MAEGKIFAGHAVRRLRRAHMLTQAAMAERLGVSASYLNLVERNQRPLSAAFMLRLADAFDADPRALAADPPGGGVEAMRRRLADPLFEGIEVDRAELEDWLAASPGSVAAFARAHDALAVGVAAASTADPLLAVERAIGRFRGHFADLDAAAEAIADELRLVSPDPGAALAERLRARHALSLRILPVDAMPDRLARLDLHARQLQLSEVMPGSARRMEAARQLALLEFGGQLDAQVVGAGLEDRVTERMYRRHLASYAAAAMLMPYARFLRACEATGYDLPLLARRFGVGWEPLAHRLTTLGRVGARGLPFSMLRLDGAGQVSKRAAGFSPSPLVEAPGRCPLWRLADALAEPGRPIAQLVGLEDAGTWLTVLIGIERGAPQAGALPARFAIALVVEARHAASLAAARGLGLDEAAAVPIGLGCRACTRRHCPQRAAPPAARALTIDRIERGVTPFTFAGD